MKVPTHRKLMFIGSLILCGSGAFQNDAVIGGVGVICLVVLSVAEDILDAINDLTKDNQ